MADWSSINNAFTNRLSTNWSTTDVAWDNVPYESTEGQEWVRAVLLPVTTENAAMGTAKKHYGIFWLQVFTPLNSGTGRGYELAEMLDGIFGNSNFDDVVCYASEITRTGDDGNGWYQTDVKVNFWSFERN